MAGAASAGVLANSTMVVTTVATKVNERRFLVKSIVICKRGWRWGMRKHVLGGSLFMHFFRLLQRSFNWVEFLRSSGSGPRRRKKCVNMMAFDECSILVWKAYIERLTLRSWLHGLNGHNIQPMECVNATPTMQKLISKHKCHFIL